MVRLVSVPMNNMENPESENIGVVVGGLILVALEVVVFRKSPKVGPYALVLVVARILSAIVGSSQLDNELASQGPVVIVPALWTLPSGILVLVWSRNALCSSHSHHVTFSFI